MHKFLIAMAALVASVVGANAQEQTCTSSGTTYQVGDVACITACHSEQARLARCESKSYGATWIYLAENCPSARLYSAPQLAFRINPHAVALMTPLPAVPQPLPAILPQTIAGETGIASRPPAI